MLLAGGCGDDTGGDEGSTPSTTDGAGTGTSQPPAPTESGDETPSTGGSADPSTGGAVSCEPDDSDDECSLCTKENCCDQLGACFADPICGCMTDCATGLNDIPMCTKMCGTSNAFSGLTSCVTVNCASECI